jgi:hypothetical protein
MKVFPFNRHLLRFLPVAAAVLIIVTVAGSRTATSGPSGTSHLSTRPAAQSRFPVSTGTIADASLTIQSGAQSPQDTAQGWSSSGVGDPGTPWGLSNVMASGTVGASKFLLTSQDGSKVYAVPTNGIGSAQPVSQRSFGTGPTNPSLPYQSEMALDPRGDRVAYLSNVDFSWHTAPLSGTGGDMRLNETTPPLGDPVWSPDGQWLAYTGNDPQTGAVVAIVSTDGLGVTRTVDPKGVRPSWFPDSKKVADITRVSDSFGGHPDVGVADITQSSAMPLQVGYFHDLGPDTEQPTSNGDQFDAFGPSAVAVSPDATRIAVQGDHQHCDQADPQGIINCSQGAEGPPGDSFAAESELGILPTGGGSFSGAQILQKFPSFAVWNASTSTVLEFLGGPQGPCACRILDGLDSPTLAWVGEGPLKITFYVDAPGAPSSQLLPFDVGHTFVEFQSEHPYQKVILGLYPTIWLYGPGGSVSSFDTNNWAYRVSYDVTQVQFNAAITFALQQQTELANGQNAAYNPFNFPGQPGNGQNCVGWAQWVANLAGISLPNANRFIGGVGLFPDSQTFADSLASLYTAGGTAPGNGVVAANDGSQFPVTNAAGAPDPPQPYPEESSPLDIAHVALESAQNASTLASAFGFRYDVTTLPSVGAGTGQTVTVGENDATLPDGAVYTLDWGDGTSPTDYGIEPGTTGSGPALTHQYSAPGTYSERLIVVQNSAIEEYDSTVTVTANGTAPGPQHFSVPAPPPSSPIPHNTNFDPGYLAGTPSPPRIQVTPGGSSATVTWSPSYPQPGTDPVTSYTVTAQPDGSTQTVAASITTATFSGLNPGMQYAFSVAATNDVGSGPPASTTATIGASVPPTTNVIIPSNGATVSGTAAALDATASNATSVEFWLFGGSYGYTGHLIGTATPTYYGWLYSWDTTTVPNGSYALLSEAFGSGGSAFSSHVSITVNNAPPATTSVIIPSNGATLSGTAATLDATASNATRVEFWLFGGSYGYSGHLVGTATPTYYGWLYSWNATTVPNGSYALLSEAFGPGGSAFSSHLSITVTN